MVLYERIFLCLIHFTSQREDHMVNLKVTSLLDLAVKPLNSSATEPPYTRSFSGPQLLSILEKPLVLDLPACSVAVEQGVNEVTNASAVCSDSLERDGLIFQKMRSRKQFPYNKRNNVYGI